MAKIQNRTINPNNKKIEIKRDGHHTGMIIRNEYWKLIKESPYSASKLLDIALTSYFKDTFAIRLDNAIQGLYEDLLVLEHLKEVGQMGLTKFSEVHQAQIESYKEAIRILENSALCNNK